MDFYRNEYPDNYEFASEKAQELYKRLKEEKYDYAVEAVSIVFPEMLRYSQYQDAIESKFDEIMAYTSEKSNSFSIGLFQMKPVFAAEMERKVLADKELKLKYPEIALDGNLNTASQKHARVLRLKEIDYQLIYLKAFVDYEVSRLKLKEMAFNERLKYLAVAYNAGINYSLEELDEINKRKSFYTGKMGLKFSYSQLCQEAASILEKKF